MTIYSLLFYLKLGIYTSQLAGFNALNFHDNLKRFYVIPEQFDV